MYFTKSIYIPATILALPFTAQATFFYPTVQASLLEHILVDTHGAHASGFADAITPCTNYVNGNQSIGRETAAQWLRVAFHDFVTAHVSDGTGGIDASIGFETLRSEDSGSAFNDSFSFFRPYVSSGVSSMCKFLCYQIAIGFGILSIQDKYGSYREQPIFQILAFRLFKVKI